MSQIDRDRVWDKFEAGEIDADELERRLNEIEDVEERAEFFMTVLKAERRNGTG